MNAPRRLARYSCRFDGFTKNERSPPVKGYEQGWETCLSRGVPRTLEEMGSYLGSKVISPPDSKLLKVAIVGVPNCGKSTLINSLMGWRVCSVSSKVHTTECNARCVQTIDSTQIIYLDTPGLVTPEETQRHNLKRTLLVDGEKSLQYADMMLVVHDVSNHHTRNTLHPRVIRLLALNSQLPSILVLNKVDILKSKRHLLDATRFLTEGIVGGEAINIDKKQIKSLSKENLLRRAIAEKNKEENINSSSGEKSEFEIEDMTIDTVNNNDIRNGLGHLSERQISEFVADHNGWPNFNDVFMISAQNGLGVDDLGDYLLDNAKPSPWIFSHTVVTDQNPHDIAIQTVREKFLDTLPKEMPYNLKFELEYWDLSQSEVLNIVIGIKCKRRSTARVVMGPHGARVRQVARESEQDLRNTFRTEVRLRLNVNHTEKKK
ncbi:unnamed protein product, partial [Meganyctiphanes norvegica]